MHVFQRFFFTTVFAFASFTFVYSIAPFGKFIDHQGQVCILYYSESDEIYDTLVYCNDHQPTKCGRMQFHTSSNRVTFVDLQNIQSELVKLNDEEKISQSEQV